MSKNLLKAVLIDAKSVRGKINTKALIAKIESGYLPESSVEYKKKKSFAPSGLVYGSGECFSANTEFLTDAGYRTFGDTVGQNVMVWTGRPAGRKGVLQSAGWKPATVEHFGKSEIVELVVSRNGVKKIIETTANHRWLVRSGTDNRVGRSKIKIKYTHELTELDSLENAGGHDALKASPDGIRHRPRWKVVSVRETGRIEDVYCVVQPETEQFTLTDGILTKNCPRYWYLAFEGGDFESDNTPLEIANMRNGSKSHERIQEAVRNTDIFVSEEKKIVYDNPPIFGFQDLEVMWNDGILPIEVKTTRDVSFQRRKDTNTALPYHVAQLLIYMKIQEADIGVILYENKDTHELFAIPVEMTKENKYWVDNAFVWMHDVYDAWKSQKLPKKNYRSNSKICKKCPLSKVCASLPAEGDITLPLLEQLK